MTKAPSPTQQEFARRTAEIRMETERMQRVLLLLESLGRREEATIKLIVDCLYDVASVRIINQKVRRQLPNRFLKSIAGFPKPIVRIVAIRWFHKNCPELITNWLNRKVSFSPPEKKPKTPAQTVAVQGVPAQPSLPAVDASNTVAFEQRLAEQRLVEKRLAEQQRIEIEMQRLRSQIRQLTGLLIGTTLFLGGTTLWFAYQSQPKWLPTPLSIEDIQVNITTPQ